MLSDRDQITNVLARYCFSIDDGDVDTWRGLFVDDAVITWGDTVLSGVDSAAGALAGAFGAGRHALMNCVVEVDGDRATAKTGFLFAYRDQTGSYSLQTTPGPHFGRYDDRLVKRDGSWLLAERAITVHADL